VKYEPPLQEIVEGVLLVGVMDVSGIALSYVEAVLVEVPPESVTVQFVEDMPWQ
jgi:hypothetical protein